VLAVMPTAREFGIENLTLEMAAVRYAGHFMERGYNGIYYTGAHDSWIRDVRLVNAELGISVYHSFFCTVTGAVLELGEQIESLYWRSIDRPKINHWLAAYALVSETLEPHPAFGW